jgi:hypothetical protein
MFHPRTTIAKSRGGTIRSAAAALAAALLLSLTLSAAAHAEYYFTKGGAEKVARDFASKKYGLDQAELATVCRPQGEAYDPDYKYHRWVCGWSDGRCSGAVLVTGSSDTGAYYGRTLRGARCS